MCFTHTPFPATTLCFHAPHINSSISEIRTFSSLSGTLLPHFYFLSYPLNKMNYFPFSKIMCFSDPNLVVAPWIGSEHTLLLKFDFFLAHFYPFNQGCFISCFREFCRWFCLCSSESDDRRICWGRVSIFQILSLIHLVLHSRFSLSIFVRDYGFSFLEGGVFYLILYFCRVVYFTYSDVFDQGCFWI